MSADRFGHREFNCFQVLFIEALMFPELGITTTYKLSEEIVCELGKCPICLLDLDIKKSANEVPKGACKCAAGPARTHCGHYFHTCCLLSHLTDASKEKREAQCPICRARIGTTAPSSTK